MDLAGAAAELFVPVQALSWRRGRFYPINSSWVGPQYSGVRLHDERDGDPEESQRDLTRLIDELNDRSAPMGIGIPKDAAPPQLVAEAGRHGAAPCPTPFGPPSRGRGMGAVRPARWRDGVDAPPEPAAAGPDFRVPPWPPILCTWASIPRTPEGVQSMQSMRSMQADGAGPPRRSGAATGSGAPERGIGFRGGAARSAPRLGPGWPGGSPPREFRACFQWREEPRRDDLARGFTPPAPPRAGGPARGWRPSGRLRSARRG
jgi:hypothetical protein